MKICALGGWGAGEGGQREHPESLYPSGSKDDPRDAELLLDLLLQHRNKLRRLTPDDEVTRRIQNLVEERCNLVDEKTAQLNRLTGYLKVYFPQMLEWFEKLDTKAVCDLLERWPSLEELQKVPPAELRKFFGQHGIKNSPSGDWRASARPCRPFGIEPCWRRNGPWCK